MTALSTVDPLNAKPVIKTTVSTFLGICVVTRISINIRVDLEDVQLVARSFLAALSAELFLRLRPVQVVLLDITLMDLVDVLCQLLLAVQMGA